MTGTQRGSGRLATFGLWTGTLLATAASASFAVEPGKVTPELRPLPAHVPPYCPPCPPIDCPPGQVRPRWPAPDVLPAPEATPRDPAEPESPTDPGTPTDPETAETPADPDQTPPQPTDFPQQATPFDNAPFDGGGFDPGGLPQLAANPTALAPNNIGDLFRAYRGVTFTYLQAGDFATVNGAGSVTIRNTKVSENNKAVPRDRIAFRYNYFQNALTVRGIRNVPDGRFNLVQGDGRIPGVQPQIYAVPYVTAEERDFDVQLFTPSIEKTFFDEQASMEVRVPFATTIDPTQNLVVGQLTPDLVAIPSPETTFPDEVTKLQDVQLIYKHVVWANRCETAVMSTGLGLTLPTGPDLDVTVVDYSNDVPGAPFIGNRRQFRDLVGPGGASDVVWDRRTRRFEVDNDTVGLAPFLALTTTPTPRSFFNGFLQFDVPLNESQWRYRELDEDLEVLFVPSVTAPNGPVQYDRSFRGTIRDQLLLQVDVGGGHWWYLDEGDRYQIRRGPRRFVRGLASAIELHYTATLVDADIVNPSNFQDVARADLAPEPLSQIGNTANEVDIVNVTLGQHVRLGENGLLSMAYVLPLLDDDDRTFDGEFSVMLNLYR